MEIVEIWKIIFNLLDLRSQIRVLSVSKFFENNLYIEDLFTDATTRINLINDDILSQPKFRNVIKLDITYNYLVSDISHLTQLKVLHAKYNPEFVFDAFDKLNLTELSTSNLNNFKFNISHMKSLKTLRIHKNEYRGKLDSVDQNIIDKLDLEELHIPYTSNIYSLAHFTNLRILTATGHSSITQECIKHLNLMRLDATDNPFIIDVSHMTNLRILHANNLLGLCGICLNSVTNLELEELYLINNGNNVPYLKTLNKLKISRSLYGIFQFFEHMKLMYSNYEHGYLTHTLER